MLLAILLNFSLQTTYSYRSELHTRRMCTKTTYTIRKEYQKTQDFMASSSQDMIVLKVTEESRFNKQIKILFNIKYIKCTIILNPGFMKANYYISLLSYIALWFYKFAFQIWNMILIYCNDIFFPAIKTRAPSENHFYI